MKHIILILLISFLLTPSFAQEGYNYYPYDLQAEVVPAEYLNGFIIVSRSNNFYALPAQVEDYQVVLQPNQIQFLLNSMKQNEMVLNGEEVPYPVEKQAAIIDSADYNSNGFLREAGVFAKAHVSRNGIPESWNEIRKIAANQFGVENYNLVSHFSNRFKGNPAANSSVNVGPNGGGGAYDQANFYHYQNPKNYDIDWEVVGNTEFINNEWGEAIEISEEWLNIMAEAKHRALLDDEISKGFNAIMGYGANADLIMQASHGFSAGQEIWFDDKFSGTEIFYQPEETEHIGIDVLNSFSNQVKAHPFMDYLVYVIGPNGGGGAYYMIQDELLEFTQHEESK